MFGCLLVCTNYQELPSDGSFFCFLSFFLTYVLFLSLAWWFLWFASFHWIGRWMGKRASQSVILALNNSNLLVFGSEDNKARCVCLRKRANGAAEEIGWKWVTANRGKLLIICPKYKEKVQKAPQFQFIPSLTQVREDDWWCDWRMTQERRSRYSKRETKVTLRKRSRIRVLSTLCVFSWARAVRVLLQLPGRC